MNRFFSALFFTSSLISATCPSSRAQDTSHGGGVGIPQGDFIVLADLSANKTIQPRATLSFLREYGIEKEVDEVLSALFLVHPYMAYRIRREMSLIKWGLTTAKLVHNVSVDPNSLLVSFDPEVQIAIRDIPGRKVYIDLNLFEHMKREYASVSMGARIPKDIQAKIIRYNRAMLAIHETLHSFINLNRNDRTETVRSMTMAIFMNFVRSKNPVFDLLLRQRDMDAAIASTKLENEFESCDFGHNFKRYLAASEAAKTLWTRDLTWALAHQSEVYQNLARQEKALNDSGTGFENILWILVNDFGNAHLLAHKPFLPETFSGTPPRTITGEYRFTDIMDSIHAGVEFIDKTNFERNVLLNELTLNDSGDYMLGTCKVHLKLEKTYQTKKRTDPYLKELYQNSFRMNVGMWIVQSSGETHQWSLDFTGASHDHPYQEQANCNFDYTYYPHELSANLIDQKTSKKTRMKEIKTQFNENLKIIYEKLNDGFCDGLPQAYVKDYLR